ncbi:MAG: RICIN domain-containing protein [Kofleriaceae bacterium]
MPKSRLLVLAIAVAFVGCLDDDSLDYEAEAQGLYTPDRNVLTQITTHLGGLCWERHSATVYYAPYIFQQSQCTGELSRDQGWVMDVDANHVTTIHHAMYDYCVDIPGGNVTSGQDLEVVRCTSSTNQRWVLETSGPYSIIHPFSDRNLCVDIEWAATTTARIQIHACNGQGNQRFRFRTVLGVLALPACAGSMNVGTVIPEFTPNILLPVTVAAGARANVQFSTGTFSLRCNAAVPLVTMPAGCPAGTNSVVVDRIANELVCMRE